MHKSVCVLFCALLAAATACSRKQPAGPPVAAASATLNKNKAAIGSPLRITYTFVPVPNAGIDGDYAVFVHVLDPDGQILWQDDHKPPVPTSRWQAGQAVEYTRTVFVPSYPYIGEAVMRLGLYNVSSGKRLSLNATEVGRQEYVVSRFEVLPQSENIFLIYREGWHSQEIDPNDPMSEWQWTKKNAAISFRNPKRDATFYLEYDARVDLFSPPQQVTLRVNGQPVATFPADSSVRTLKTFPVSAAQLGTVEMAEIGLDLDRMFRPGDGREARELGIRVYHTFVEPK